MRAARGLCAARCPQDGDSGRSPVPGAPGERSPSARARRSTPGRPPGSRTVTLAGSRDPAGRGRPCGRRRSHAPAVFCKGETEAPKEVPGRGAASPPWRTGATGDSRCARPGPRGPPGPLTQRASSAPPTERAEGPRRARRRSGPWWPRAGSATRLGGGEVSTVLWVSVSVYELCETGANDDHEKKIVYGKGENLI